MTQDCYDWELERTVWNVEWIVKIEAEIITPMRLCSILVDAPTKDNAINRAWNWACLQKDKKPTSKSDMSATPFNMII